MAICDHVKWYEGVAAAISCQLLTARKSVRACVLSLPGECAGTQRNLFSSSPTSVSVVCVRLTVYPQLFAILKL